MKKHILLILIISLTLSCETTKETRITPVKSPKYSGQIVPGKWLRDVAVPITYNGESSVAKIQVFFPKEYIQGKKFRTIIALHQYDNGSRDWETSSPVESLANKYRFVIVCPAMGKTLYENSYYPETTNRWNIIPGGKFIGEVLVPFLNDSFGLAVSKSGTGIMGITVGAHGAILVAETYPDRFGAVAGISGYYDPTIIQNSKMIESVYGSYKSNQLRWETEDNTLKNAEKLSGVAVFLYHGGKGDAFQEGQSRIMGIRLKQLQNKSSSYSITYSEQKNYQYGWTWWKTQVPAAMEFFDVHLKE
ncbi:MAG TPA: alpha/beta hydrolase-fold protein [Spirochaetota bacterium]|nr:alpha/beta hydrolase-fold protein [Spirochaetota bacterium]